MSLDKETRGLLQRAVDDEIVIHSPGMPDGVFGQHAHAAIEKFYKALLNVLTGTYPYVHDLDRLNRLLLDAGEDVPTLVIRAALLTKFSTHTRYAENGDIDPLDRPACKEAVRVVREYVERRLRELGKL
jgi:HEPN domain-containing protein